VIREVRRGGARSRPAAAALPRPCAPSPRKEEGRGGDHAEGRVPWWARGLLHLRPQRRLYAHALFANPTLVATPTPTLPLAGPLAGGGGAPPRLRSCVGDGASTAERGARPAQSAPSPDAHARAQASSLCRGRVLPPLEKVLEKGRVGVRIMAPGGCPGGRAVFCTCDRNADCTPTLCLQTPTLIATPTPTLPLAGSPCRGEGVHRRDFVRASATAQAPPSAEQGPLNRR
jgi:hypothetical protein